MKKFFLTVVLSGVLVLGFAANYAVKTVPSNDVSVDTAVKKIGILIETNEPEKAWNAFRFAIVAVEQGCEVRVFLMGEGVECIGIRHERFNVEEKFNDFVALGGNVLACGTCLKSRNMQGAESCPMSNMMTCVDMVLWADKMVTF